MSRWEADGSGRLQQAAMELFTERGYDNVTVAEIAERAGLTKRSFFRHYPEKREVLFSGSADFQRAVLEHVRRAVASAPPLGAVTTALAEVGATLTQWGEPVRQRQRIIASSTELRERELIKLDALATAIADALHTSGVADQTAVLTAQIAIAAFTTAFDQWAATPDQPDFPALMDEAVERTRALVSDRAAQRPTA